MAVAERDSRATYRQRFKSPIERFREKYIANAHTGCWEWQAARKIDSDYGFFNLDGRHRSAHRAAYELFVGEIPEGLVLDHLCGNAACVNPSHLEPVTQKENRRRQQLRQTHCRNGHELAGANLALVRVCRTCRSATLHRHVTKKRGERTHA